MQTYTKSEHSIRSFSTEVSERVTLEIYFMDLAENSTVTSVILITGIETKIPRYKHITDVVMKSWSLHKYCTDAMKAYLNMCKEPDEERYDLDEAQEEFTGARLDDYKTFLH